MGILVPHKHTAIMMAMSRVLQGMLGLGMLASTAFGSSTDTQDWRYPCLGGKNEIIVNDIHSGRMNKITFNENNGTLVFSSSRLMATTRRGRCIAGSIITAK